MKKSFRKKNLDKHLPGKSDKNDIIDAVMSCSIFDKYIFFLKNTFLSLAMKRSISA